MFLSMKRVFLIMVAAMAMSCAMAQSTQTCVKKENCKSKCEQRKECAKKECADAKCAKCTCGNGCKKAESKACGSCCKKAEGKSCGSCCKKAEGKSCGSCCKKAEGKSCDKCTKQANGRMCETEVMVKRFNLTADQAAKVKALNEQYPDQACAGVGRHRAGVQGKACSADKECQKKQEAYDAGMRKILTKDQYALYERSKQMKKCKYSK